MKRSVLIVIVVLLLLVVYVAGSYNQMVVSRENISEAWAQVENVYQRRADLIPNLVNTVKGFAAQEKDVLIGVTEARSKVGQMQLKASDLNKPQLFQQFQQAQGELSSALSRLMVVVEKYPDLKSNENFLALQSQLEGTENRISVERRRYNMVVQRFNTQVRRVPGRFFAGMFGFEGVEYFQADAGAAAVPKVEF
jgi:LemA protein